VCSSAFWPRDGDRNPLGWGLLAFVISPLIAGIVLLIVGEGQTARCPFCAERIKMAARVCPHCQRELTTPVEVLPPVKR
jgi:predicted amidophosphoribosyltransferase